MNKLKCLPSAPARLSVAMPLIFGLATIAAIPAVEAMTVNEVDIFNGYVDVDEDGDVDAADDLPNVALWSWQGTPIRVDIIDGGFDVNEDGVVNLGDNWTVFYWNNENEIDGYLGVPTTRAVFIDYGRADILDSTYDNSTNIDLFVLP